MSDDESDSTGEHKTNQMNGMIRKNITSLC
jgi:hypothetical protein